MVGGFGPAAPELFDVIVANLVRCIDQVPADVQAGLHLCYGDYGHQHFRQPESLELQSWSAVPLADHICGFVPEWLAPPSKARPDCTLVMLDPLPDG